VRKGLLFTVSGPSGVGKGTVCRALVARMSDVALSVSCTTRAPREGEEEGVSYFFVCEAAFDGMIAQDEFLEHAGVYGKRYGTPARYVDSMLEDGRDVILEIEMNGCRQVMKKRPDTIGVFILPPDFQTQKSRLLRRATETPEQVDTRMRSFPNEVAHVGTYDYVLVNDQLELAVDRLEAIIHAERMKTKRNTVLINRIIQSYQEGFQL